MSQPRGDEGGVVVVTEFACRTVGDVLLVWWLHHRLEPSVRAHAEAFLGVRLFIDWRRRLVRSVSLWTALTGLYDMGKVHRHIAATRIAARRQITTSGGVYRYGGDWRTLLFGDGYVSPPPLARALRGENDGGHPADRPRLRRDHRSG